MRIFCQSYANSFPQSRQTTYVPVRPAVCGLGVPRLLMGNVVRLCKHPNNTSKIFTFSSTPGRPRIWLGASSGRLPLAIFPSFSIPNLVLLNPNPFQWFLLKILIHEAYVERYVLCFQWEERIRGDLLS